VQSIGARRGALSGTRARRHLHFQQQEGYYDATK
jgi:hypothetical protein